MKNMCEFVLYSHYLRTKEGAVAKIIEDINKHVDIVHKINLRHFYFLYGSPAFKKIIDTRKRDK